MFYRLKTWEPWVRKIVVRTCGPLLLLLLITPPQCFVEGGSFQVFVEDTVVAPSGTDLKIICRANVDVEKAALQWYIMTAEGRKRVYYKKGHVTYPSDNQDYRNRLSIVDDFSLLVRNVIPLDEREFICSITLGTTEANSTHVKIFAFPDLKLSESTHPLFIDNTFQKVADCVAEGYPQPELAWFKTWKRIYESRDVEIKTNVTRNDIGMFTVSSMLKIRPQETGTTSPFHCSIMTPDGAVECMSSIDIRLTVNKPTILEVSPSNFIQEGDTVTLTCVTYGLLPHIIYTFFQESTQLGDERTENVWTIPDIKRNQNGVYSCQARDTVETTVRAEHDINVHYIERLQILGIPDGEVNEGDNIMMTCSASSSGNITYHWNKDGKWNEDGHILTRLHVSLSDSGSYTCVAGLVEGSIFVDKTENIIVKGIDGVQILGVPEGEVNEGENISMTCNARAFTNITYHWNKDGKRKEDGHILTRLNVTSYDSGLYMCVVQLEDGSMCVNETVNITVKGINEVQILGVPDGEVNEGENITMTCNARAFRKITYHWNQNGKWKEDGHILTCLNVTSYDSGSYTCVAQLEDGSMSVDETVNITVKGINEVQILGVPDGEVNEGENITMTCNARAFRKTTYHWNKDGKRKEDGHILTRLHVSSLDSGAYTCVAQLEDGSMSVAKTVTITVKGPWLFWIFIASGVVGAVAIILIFVAIYCIHKRGWRTLTGSVVYSRTSDHDHVMLPPRSRSAGAPSTTSPPPSDGADPASPSPLPT
ncbi:CD166 antigen-like isoform X2 [Lampetra planeri]